LERACAIANGKSGMHTAPNLDRTRATERCRRFRERFPDRERVFLPVSYAAEEKRTLHNVDIAREAHADGLFLVNHGIGSQRLLRIAQKVVGLHPGLFVGVNCLDLHAQDVIRRLPDGVAGVWTDDPLTADGVRPGAASLDQARQSTGWDGLLFAAVGPEAAADRAGTPAAVVGATAYADVPTIVAAGLGPRDVQVVRELSRTLGRQPLAVAARITSEGVDALLPYATCIMTAAQANDGLEHMDVREATQLAAKIHAR